MAKLFITGFGAHTTNTLRVIGFYTDTTTGQYETIDLAGLVFDPNIATSVRQQLQDNLVPEFNQTFAGRIPAIIASDIEYVS